MDHWLREGARDAGVSVRASRSEARARTERRARRVVGRNGELEGR
jgi:hypothetical protein